MALRPSFEPFDATDVVPRIRAGDVSAFEALYRALFPPVYDYAYRFLRSKDAAEDVVQDVFRHVWERREACPAPEIVRAYLFTAVRNRIRKQWRHNRVVDASAARFTDDDMPGMGRPDADPAQYTLNAELRAVLDQLLANTPEHHREILLMRWQLGMSYPEIAQVLGLSVAAAQAQVSRLQRSLRPLLHPFLEPD